MLALTGFHNWFKSSIHQWLQIVHERSCDRIRKAVDTDKVRRFCLVNDKTILVLFGLYMLHNLSSVINEQYINIYRLFVSYYKTLHCVCVHQDSLRIPDVPVTDGHLTVDIGCAGVERIHTSYIFIMKIKTFIFLQKFLNVSKKKNPDFSRKIFEHALVSSAVTVFCVMILSHVVT